MTESKEELICKVSARLEMMRLDAIHDRGLWHIYRGLYETALQQIDALEEHDWLEDLRSSLEVDGPYGVHKLEWKRKCKERGYGLSQDEFDEWAEGEVADMVGRLQATQGAT